MEDMRISLNKPKICINHKENIGVSETILKMQLEKAIKDCHVYGVALKKPKRFRSAFTTEQINYLENAFKINPYVNNTRRKEVATFLNIPERAVKIWFQNRRMKEKKDSFKDLDTDKNNKLTYPLNNLSAQQSTNDGSLPVIASQLSPISDEECTIISKIENLVQDNFASSSCKMEVNCEHQIEIQPKNSNSATVIRKPASSTIVHLTSSTPYELENSKKSAEPVRNPCYHELPSTSLRIAEHKIGSHHLSSDSFSPPLLQPQDLTLKANPHRQVVQPNNSHDLKFNQHEIPLYMKGFYTQPYIPANNMIWRPVNMASMVPAPVTVMPGPSTVHPHMKSNCTCNCHESYPESMLLNGQCPNIQYVVTAVPFQNTAPKL